MSEIITTVRAVFSQAGYKDIIVEVGIYQPEFHGDPNKIKLSCGFTKKHFTSVDCFAMQMCTTFLSRISDKEIYEIEEMLKNQLDQHQDIPAEKIFNINLN